jgi:lipoprotein-anchoring transpeptidase ErfK/SrfK
MEHNQIINPANLRVGMELRIPNPFFMEESASGQKAAYHLEIRKSTNTLSVFNNNKLLLTFRVATGKDAKLTPIGTFKIVNKLKDPWYSPKDIIGGSPQNPLGTRWLGLNVPYTDGTKYGIHGTNDPSSTGKNVSLGCIRINNKDVQWLYDQIPVGTKVIIRN